MGGGIVGGGAIRHATNAGGPVRRWLWGVVARLAARSKKVGRYAQFLVLGLAASAVLFGWIGWVQYDNRDPNVSLDLATIAFGTASLFVFAGTAVANVPGFLQAARLLAPLATATATATLIVAAGRGWLNRVAGKHARSHLVLIGPADRVEVHIGRGGPERVLHADPEQGRAIDNAIDIGFEAGGPWVPSVAAADARRIVVATGDDHLNLLLLAELVDLVIEQPDLQVTVEIDDRSAALTLAALLAKEHPGQDIDVICPDDLAAGLAAETVLEHFTLDQTVVVSGDGLELRLLTAQIADALRRRHLVSATERPRLAIVSESERERRALCRRLGDATTLDLESFADMESMLAWSDGPLIAVIDHSDRSRSVQEAIELAWDRPGSIVCVRSEAGSLPLGLVPLNLAAVRRKSDLVGPWLRAADLWMARCGPDLDGTGVGSTVSQARRKAVAAHIRVAIASLVNDQQWGLSAADRLSVGEENLPKDLLSSIGLGPLGGELPFVIRQVGFTLHRPGAPKLRRGETPGPPDEITPSDEQIVAVARAVHDGYVSDHIEDGGSPEDAAATPWERLEPELQAQNYQQARENIWRLRSLGIYLVPLGSGEPAGRLSLAGMDLEAMARSEHDRWSHQKRAQGYILGALDKVGPPKRHPDLRAWEDLTEKERDKDRRPMMRMVETLRVAGLSLR